MLKLKSIVWFTLIEIIVVISIISIISTSGLVYFYSFIEWRELKQDLDNIKSHLNDLDTSVRNYDVFDYELHINTSDLSRWYISYLNKYDIGKYQEISFNSNNWDIIIDIENWEVWELWNIKTYQWLKILDNLNLAWTDSYTWSFIDSDSYTVKSTLVWEHINDILINYFSPDNIENNAAELELTWIYNSEDKSGWDMWDLIIYNIWWNKYFNSWDETIYLYFEKKWVEDFIKLTK